MTNCVQDEMEKKQCGECKQAINDLDPVRCGFCDDYFHISQQCCGFNTRGNKDALTQGKIMFVCSPCRDKLKGRCVNANVADKLNDNQSQAACVADLPKQVVKLVDAMDALGQKIDNFSLDSVQSTALQHPTTPVAPVLRSARSLKRRRIEPYASSTVQATTVCGTKVIDLTSLSVPTIIPATAEKFWLYLSRLNPLISDDDVKTIVSRCLNLDGPIDVVRLVPRGKDISTLSFVSFKIGLDPERRDDALNPSSWPAGLLFREFINQSKNINPSMPVHR